MLNEQPALLTPLEICHKSLEDCSYLLIKDSETRNDKGERLYYFTNQDFDLPPEDFEESDLHFPESLQGFTLLDTYSASAVIQVADHLQQRDPLAFQKFSTFRIDTMTERSWKFIHKSKN